MKIIPIPQPPPPTPAKSAALSILAHVNAAAGQAVGRQVELYGKFWDNQQAPPDEILAEMGPLAVHMLSAAEESKRHLTSFATIAGLELADIISLDYIIPRREFIISDDGTVTLAPPAEGFDAWGRPLPVEPELESEPEIEPQPETPNEP
jgi:hypothetical protein